MTTFFLWNEKKVRAWKTQCISRVIQTSLQPIQKRVKSKDDSQTIYVRMKLSYEYVNQKDNGFI